MKVTTVLALATLGGTTENSNDPITFAPPKVAKASKEGDIMPHYRGCYSSKLCQWKLGFTMITCDHNLLLI
jgi:hypothetical protein